ncbi:dipeptide ABC transporter ATP binding subunit DppD [Paraburkholderia unamae]|uniref:ABC transporter ATP-binding protein n=1 Tax=Paraburkholderia unamae TaxID=219649 RepID=UPI001CB4496E|nr:ABC transporter ATP-binding protein [Paraburkholderia unamae]CAG9261691.1 dipeptide ABC transporter ATP binding subunit DppD [Paraburkholderia unamae]
MSNEAIALDVKQLCVRFATPAGQVHALTDVTLRVRRGETLALVGESGSGKSVTSLSLMRLLGGRAQLAGEAWLHPGASAKSAGSAGSGAVDLLALGEKPMMKLRGNRISMVFQEPMTSLNPLQRIGKQVEEALTIHGMGKRGEVRERAIALLGKVGISDPASRAKQYPHQLSGGMRQRVMIAIALACEPAVLLADEPTTALDVTVQAQILELIRKLQQEAGMAVVFITHDMGVVAQIADRVAVMYGGQIVETAPTAELFAAPKHPYTRALLDSIPRPAEGGALRGIPGQIEAIVGAPTGCRFANRCTRAEARCSVEVPAQTQVNEVHSVRCHFWNKV